MGLIFILIGVTLKTSNCVFACSSMSRSDAALFFCVLPAEFQLKEMLPTTLDARGLLVRQRRGASERVVLVSERPLARAVKSFERADTITLPFISPESKFDPGNLIGWLKKRFLKGLLLVKCAMILGKPVLPIYENKKGRRGPPPFRDSEGSKINC